MSILQERLDEKFTNEELKVIKYTTMKEEAKVKCNNCNEIYTIGRAENFLRRKRICKNCCPTEEFQKTIDRFTVWLETSDFELVQDLKRVGSSQSHIKCKCKLCGLTQENKTIYNYLEGKKCYCKNKGTKKPKEVLLKELGSDYFLLEEYSNTDDKLLFEHKCGCIFRMRVSDLLRYKGICPGCNFNRSNGERKIEAILNENKIKFTREKKVLIDGKCFRYDFFIEDTKTFIEYNGIQHYEPVEFFGGKLAFEKRVEYDNIKRKFCDDNNITLIEIKYNESIKDVLIEKGVI